MPDIDDAMVTVVAQWVAAGPALAEARRQQVAALTDAEALAATCALLDAVDALGPHPPRRSSGLVDQQRLLRALHPR